MKNQAPMWVALTLVMLLLVALATILFLFQGRYTLQAQTTALSAEKASLEASVAQSATEAMVAQEGRLSAEATALAAAALQATLEADLTGVQAQLATEQAAPTATAPPLPPPTPTPVAPRAQFFVPLPGALALPGTSLDIVATVMDPSGVVSVTLSVEDEVISVYAGDGGPLYTLYTVWEVPADVPAEIALTVQSFQASGQPGAQATLVLDTRTPEEQNAALRAEIEERVSVIRDLSAREPVEPTLLSRQAFTERLETEFEEDLDPDELADSVLVFYSLNLIERDYDLYQAYLDLYSGSVSGFYDAETNEFVVISDDDTLSLPEQLTHAHEFVHALQDQHFALDELNDESLDSEASAALRALAEGEATLVELAYIQEFLSPAEQVQLQQEAAANSPGLPAGVPGFLIDNLLFPYTAGFEFVLALYQRGGFEALDAAWANPPQSTEHILHPEQYLAGDPPQLVALAPLTDTLGVGWREVESEIMGEFFLRIYLGEELDIATTEEAAAGWGGDRFQFYTQDASGAFVLTLLLTWDTPADSDEFVAAYTQYADGFYHTPGQPPADAAGRCWQTSDVTCLYQNEDGDTLVVRAPDLETAQRVAGENGY